MEQEHSGYRSKEEEIAAKEFEVANSNETKDTFQSQKNEERIDELVLEQLGNFQRTKTEQFETANQALQQFSKELSERFSTEDQKEIYDALMLMYTLHIYQEDRPEGSPYVSHPMAVAEKVLAMSPKPDKELVIAALMHDSVEDQADKLSSLYGQETTGIDDKQRAMLELERRYGDRVRNIVAHLSNPDFSSILESQGITEDNPQYQEAKNKLYAEHVAEAIKNPDVLVIKLADFSDNGLRLDRLPEQTEEQKAQKQKFTRKYRPVMKVFSDRLAQDNLYPDIREELKQQYNKLQA